MTWDVVFIVVGVEHSSDGNYNAGAEVGWYILGENQQNVGPYAFSELCGEFYMFD